MQHRPSALLIVRSFCSRCLLLSRGQLDMDGPADAVIQRHLGDGNTADTGGTACLRAHPNRLGGMSPVLTGLRLLNPAGQPCSNFCQSDRSAPLARRRGHAVAGAVAGGVAAALRFHGV